MNEHYTHIHLNYHTGVNLSGDTVVNLSSDERTPPATENVSMEAAAMMVFVQNANAFPSGENTKRGVLPWKRRPKY